MKKKYILFLATLIVNALLTGCSLDTSGLGGSGNRSFIDAPLDETISEVGIPIAITTHANFVVDKILVDINTVPTNPAAMLRLETTTVEVTPGLYESRMLWVPIATGRYKLMAYSYTDGRINGWDSWTTHTIYITIVERATGGGEPAPTPLPTQPPTETEPEAAQPPAGHSQCGSSAAASRRLHDPALGRTIRGTTAAGRRGGGILRQP